ncbi:MAG: ATP-dependent helicase [Saccharofermentans sp.]|nr:ATP-dependent helicase [Saccharofermentans sp.]
MKTISEINKGLLANLTPDQCDCVMCIDRNLEIVACAGAGKTKTITHRILNLIDHGVDPANIVAITFTTKAAAELKGRIYKLGQDILGSTTGFSQMYIGTIDAFCLKMLQEYKDEYTKFSVLDDIQTKVFLERFEKKEETGFAGSKIDKARNLNYTYDFENKTDVRDNKIDKKINHYASLMAILNNCWHDKTYRSRWDEETLENLKAYNKCLRDNCFFDFSGLIREMIENLDPDSDTNQGRMSDFAQEVYEKVKYLIIDEYQDTNPAQEYLTELFYKYGKANICVVGDADQTIYQFRGSDESNILSFREKFQAVTKNLNWNFRSTPAVIDIAATAIADSHKGDDGYKRMVRAEDIKTPLDYEDGDTVYAEFSDFDKEAAFIAERVNKLRDLGIPYKDMAVLLRKRGRNYYGEITTDFQQALAARFKEEGIPYVIEGMNHLFATDEYKASLGIFRYLHEKMARSICINRKSSNVATTSAKFGFDENGKMTVDSRETEKPKFVNGYMNDPNLSDEDKKAKEKEQTDKLKELWIAVGGFISEDCIDEAIKRVASIDWKTRKYGNDCNMQQIYLDFVAALNIVGIEDPSEEVERVLYNLGKFSRVIADFERIFFKESPVYKLRDFIKHMEHVAEGLYPEGMEDNPYLQADGVRIMTVHQSKGLEFTAVFVPALVQSVFPGEPFDKKGKVYSAIDVIKENWIPNYAGYEGGVEAERKIFYVAVSRAKKYLFLTCAKDYGVRYYGKIVAEKESQFLTEVKESAYLKKFNGSVNYGTQHLPETEETLLPITLNFSILSNYYDCPYRFKISNMFGFVQPYDLVQGYGKMIHEIMMRIHNAWMKGETLTDSRIDEIAENALFLPFAIKPQLERALEDTKRCAKAYVEQNKDDADKIVASEMDINIEMGEGISVNGRIDLVRKMDLTTGKDKTAVIDLKSAGKDAEQCLNAEQLKIYAIGYEEASGVPADYLMIYNLDKPDGSGNKGELVDKQSLEETKKSVVEAARCIRASDFPKRKSDKCKNCYVKNLCGSSCG